MRLDLENQGGCSTVETDLENLHGSLVSVWAPWPSPQGITCIGSVLGLQVHTIVSPSAQQH